MIYGYIRTSTDKQNNENQHFGIEQFAKNNNITIDKWIEETISSRKSLDERRGCEANFTELTNSEIGFIF